MALTSGYFNSVNGDRLYNAEQMTMYFKGLVSDGIFSNVGNKFAITASGNGMTATVGTGRGLLLTHWVENDSSYQIVFDVANTQYNRYDRVVLHCDLTESSRNISILVKKGTPSANPVKPALETTTDNVKELLLADVLIEKNSTAVTQARIQDCRGTSLCPWITGLITQADTTTIFDGYQQACNEYLQQMENYFTESKNSFDSWLATLQSELTVSTKLKKYQSTYTTTAETTDIPLISNYETGDVLLVHIGGVLFVEDSEYTIDTANSKIVLKNSITTDNTVTQILVKSVIG